MAKREAVIRITAGHTSRTSNVRRQRPVCHLLLHWFAGGVGTLQVREGHVQRFVAQPLPQRVHAYAVALMVPAGK